MSLTIPPNSRGPILDLTLPASEDALDIVLRNKTTEKRLVLKLPAGWEGDDLELDFFRRTIKDQTGIDRSALLDPSDNDLWVPEPLVVGANDVEIEAFDGIVQFTSEHSGAAFADDSSIGTGIWSNPSNAAKSDDSRATALAEAGKPTHYLKVTDFKFASAIPAGSRIKGIQDVHECSSVANKVEDNSVRLVKGGIIQGADRAGGVWPLGDLPQSSGGSTDLWGLELTRADVVASDFGVAISAKVLSGSDTARVDHVGMFVWFEAPAAYGATATLRWEKGYF